MTEPRTGRKNTVRRKFEETQEMGLGGNTGRGEERESMRKRKRGKRRELSRGKERRKRRNKQKIGGTDCRDEKGKIMDEDEDAEREGKKGR